ncbi:MAG: Bug family tripartite tricarboxylate transporter substrate binding protein [Burkholderiales bacterium]
MRMFLFVIALLLAAIPASAQWKAERPIRIVVPFTPGGGTDLQARRIAPALAEALGVAVVVENRPGAGTLIGAREVAKSPPDGSTLLYTVAAMTQLPHLHRTPPFDLFRDFTPITPGSLGGTVLVARVGAPFSTVRELVEYAKQNPGKLNVGSYGTGTTAHLNVEFLKRIAGIEVTHVPYPGPAQANQDLYGGRIDMFFDGPTTAIASAKGGKAKLIAAATEKRIPALPGLTTFHEAGLAFGIDGWIAFFGPGGMKADIVATLHREIARIVNTPEFRKFLFDSGLDYGGMPPDLFAAKVRADYERWGNVIREAGVRLD